MTLQSLPQYLCLLLVTVLVTVLVGCAARPSMDELEQQALETGDWSEVQKRQRMDRAMGRVDPSQQCPNGGVLLCGKNGEQEECQCVPPHTIRAR